MKKYATLKNQHGDFLSLDEFAKVCKISKKSARYLVERGIIPAIDTGKRTWQYKIAIDDVIAYLERREKVGSMIPPGATSSRSPRRVARKISTRKSFSQMVTPGREHEIAEYFEYIYADCGEILTTADIVEMTGLKKTTVINLLNAGRIKSIESSPTYLIPKQYLLDFVVTRHFIECRSDSELFKKILGGFEIWKTAKSSQ